MAVDPTIFGATGFAFPVISATADYPAVGKVASGYSYDFGNLIGTRTDASPTDVRAGRSYGDPDSPFTGTLVVPTTPTLGPSLAATVADAVVAWLNYPGRGWTTSGWTATRNWAPDISLPDLKSQTATVPLVEVVPDSAEPEEGDTRGSEEFTLTVFIIVRSKYQTTGPVPNSWVDPLADLAEQIADQLRNEEFDLEKRVVCEETKLDPLIDPTALRVERTAISVIEATFRVYRVS